MSTEYRWKATLLRWIDGDTIVARVDLASRAHSLGFNLKFTPPGGMDFESTFRIRGIDTPELRGEERDLGKRALDHVVKRFPPPRPIEIVSWPDVHAGFGRWLCDLWIDGYDIALLLVEEGYARMWDGRTKRVPFLPEEPYPLHR